MSNPLLDHRAHIVIAHRGNRVRAPENTIVSLREAVDLGVDAIEFDVRASRDGVPVVIHDATLDRTTNGRGAVAAFTARELADFDAAARRVESPARIPTLEEVLDTFRETPLVVEVKELAVAEATERLIRRFGAAERVLIGSAVTAVMEWFYRSGLPSCASMRDATRFIPRAIAGLPPLRPTFHVLSVTRRFRGFPIPVARMASVASRIGIATQVWTVNDPARARTLWAGGVSGIVTDDPAAILRARAR